MSKVPPFAIQDRPELNLRQGIKSSLNNWRQLLSSLYLYFLYVCDGARDTYCKEIQRQGRTSLSLGDSFAQWIAKNWNSIPSIDTRLAMSPLFLAQMEHLQVGLELFLKLAKVEFADSGLSSASERTGGSRYCKKLHFSTNMKIYADAISRHTKNDITTFLDCWLSNKDDYIIGEQVKEMLITFTEECQYKIRVNAREVYFQENGVYEQLRNPENTVESSDEHEPVGPFRILKSFIKEGMHPYIADSADGFKVKSDIHTFSNYADLVNTSLMLIPKRTTVFQEVAQETPPKESPTQLASRQLIIYGPPGTGKSRGIKEMMKDCPDRVIRTTFHPDSDYSTFVGSYKPTMVDDPYETIVQVNKIVRDREGKDSVQSELKPVRQRHIAYLFVGQAFTKAYVKAWKAWAERPSGGVAESVYLIIEEINRGNCAQVFGDIFQLLDRENGFSQYPIQADEDLRQHLAKEFEGLDFGEKFEKVRLGQELVLPSNLYIWATMNTSDQSLFPMDSAFKRRWDWQHVPIKDAAQNWQIVFSVEEGGKVERKTYPWWDFLCRINDVIERLTSSEDKQMGYFFVKPINGEIDEKLLVNKVFFYLWNDVFRDVSDVEELEVMIDGHTQNLKFHHFFNVLDGKEDEASINTHILRDFMDKLMGSTSPAVE